MASVNDQLNVGEEERKIQKCYWIEHSQELTVEAMMLDSHASDLDKEERPEIINVYNQEYESGAAFWPDVHGRIISALVISQLLLMGLLGTKEVAKSTPLLIVLPILTIWFHRFCKKRYESAFVKYPLQEAMMKDTLEHAREPNLDLKAYLSKAYVHPVFKGGDEDEILSADEEEEYEKMLVPTRRQSRINTPVPSKYNGSSSSSLRDRAQE